MQEPGPKPTTRVKAVRLFKTLFYSSLTKALSKK